MRAVLQRAHGASVTVNGTVVGSFDGEGIVALVGVARGDGEEQVEKTARKIAELRMLDGERSASEADAPILVISQFTLYGETRKGRRPSWSAAAGREVAEPLITQLVESLRSRGITVETGEFGAQMEVQLVNSGPFTLLVEV